MSIWHAALLGLIQGLTEFLPVSSSGHLVLAKYLLGVETAASDNVAFEIFVHFGTVLSIITIYWRDILALIREFFKAIASPTTISQSYSSSEPFRHALFILITLIPTGIVYILFSDFLESKFSDPKFVCGMLLVTGLLLLLTVLRKNPSGKLTPVKALFMGIAQSAAMIPGISRSGSTICSALYMNVEPERAANFSFLMLLPVVLGATLLKSLDAFSGGLSIGAVPIVVGTLVAYISGVIAIKLLLDVVRRGKLQYFAFYCFAAGLLGLFILS